MTAEHAAFMPDLPADAPDADPAPPVAHSLAELAAMVRRERALTSYPTKSWVLPKPAPDGTVAHDVVIVGAGQSGLATGFALQRQRVDRILLIDENARGAEGPWGRYARMPSLRTDKDVGGLDLGLPSLSLRAWFEAQYGAAAWRAVGKLPRDLWHRYLAWYREVLALPVRNRCRLLGFRPDPASGLLALDVEDTAGSAVLWARKLVLATGIEGNGRRQIPDFIAQSLPRRCWAHSQEAIDFAALAGRTVAVLGGGASAFDNAATAAEAGAAQVHLYHRRRDVVPANPVAWSQFNGFLEHFADLDIATRWRFTSRLQVGASPPSETVARVARLPNLTVHPGTSWRGVALAPGAARAPVRIDATDGALQADFVILGTGYELDIASRPELAPHAARIALWRDVHHPPPDEENDALGAAPFLGPHFELRPKQPEIDGWLGSVFNFGRGAQLSMGTIAIGLSGIKFGAPRLAQGITRQLFCEDAGLYLDGMTRWQRSGVVTDA